MLNTELRSKVDRLWDNFWSGGISNPLTVVEQISYLLFIKRLDDREILEERKANQLGRPHQSIFTSEACRWSVFCHYDSQKMLDIMLEKVFPFIKTYGKEENTAFYEYMKDAVFMIQKPSLLHEAVQLIDGMNMDDQDTKGDLYEYLLSKLSTAGVNGQFRTPRHIIKMMVELLDPNIDDVICDPACGTAGFLVTAAEHILRKYTSPALVFTDDDGNVHDKIGDQLTDAQRDHYYNHMFHGTDFDTSMLRISSMNLMLHGFDKPNISYADALSSRYEVKDRYTMILANPPFKGSLDEGDINASLRKVVKTKKTELLFLALMLRTLDLGGRCAVIVPDGVLFGSSTAHKSIRKALIEENQLEAIISMPSGVFKPYAGVSTAVVIFTKGGRTDTVWFYDMQADGYSLDDKRNVIEDNDIDDIIERFKNLQDETTRQRTDKSFFVPKEEIVGNEYDLSINKYKEIEHEEVEYEHPQILLDKIKHLEKEIQEGIDELEDFLL
ncbi:type I restriction-modification system subunit M [Sporomusa malonica]|uniref:site-specific DNA-methyltransferase (adenine-specific) n=1 Tax=Sporomusa malonica TaxID=112901 RepID=A0A1W2BAX2_9FIRM|nr:class I SAM-dependent DNA methyltransferase [Sporomusa malonica]SMC70183.1 type I restriction enzyme M protein [Sporomusa malonica]